jgi:hypothetical protein
LELAIDQHEPAGEGELRADLCGRASVNMGRALMVFRSK